MNFGRSARGFAVLISSCHSSCRGQSVVEVLPLVDLDFETVACGHFPDKTIIVPSLVGLNILFMF